jgi:hypothetical protein
MLSAIAELLDAQETPLSDKQIACLDRLLFGGMGSRTDLWFDPASVGDQANSVNAGLDRQKDGLSTIALKIYCNLAYSALACCRMGISGSASFQRVRKF